jgi:hypothetical protein
MEEKVTAPVLKVNDTAVGIRHADHVALSIRKSSPTSGGSSVDIVRSRTQAMENKYKYNRAHEHEGCRRHLTRTQICHIGDIMFTFQTWQTLLKFKRLPTHMG